VQTVDMLARAIQGQSQQIRELKSKLEDLERRQVRQKVAEKHEWQAFQWLFDRVPDVDDDEVCGTLSAMTCTFDGWKASAHLQKNCVLCVPRLSLFPTIPGGSCDEDVQEA
jgi:hypothetical protein